MKRLLFGIFVFFSFCLPAQAAFIPYTASGSISGLQGGPQNVSGTVYLSNQLSFYLGGLVPEGYPLQNSYRQFSRPIIASNVSIGQTTLTGHSKGVLYFEKSAPSTARPTGVHVREWWFSNSAYSLWGGGLNFYDANGNLINGANYPYYLYESPYQISLNFIGGSGFPIVNQNQLFGSTIWLTRANTGTAAPVPEPASLILLGVGLMGIAGLSKKKLRK